ncbi:MAG: hypothetical protein WBF88_18665 [Pusillimonas sp.]
MDRRFRVKPEARIDYSAYISYSDIFNPQSNKSSDGNTLKPVMGANYEVGIIRRQTQYRCGAISFGTEKPCQTGR